MDLGPGPYKYRAPNIQSAFRLWISTLAQDSRTSAVDFSSGLSRDSALWTSRTQHTGLDSAQLQRGLWEQHLGWSQHSRQCKECEV